MCKYVFIFIYFKHNLSIYEVGAMENKGLNIFNTALTLAKASTATDGMPPP
jgi:aminopeptidase N